MAKPTSLIQPALLLLVGVLMGYTAARSFPARPSAADGNDRAGPGEGGGNPFGLELAPETKSTSAAERLAAAHSKDGMATLEADGVAPFSGTGQRSAKFRNYQLDRDLSSILLSSDPIARSTAFGQILEQVDAGNIQRALAAFEDLPSGVDRDREYQLLLYAWGKVDPAAAMEYVESSGKQGWRSYRSNYSVLSAWASTHPDAAERWAREKTEREDNPYMVGVINGTAKHDLNRATEMTFSLPYGRVRGQAVGVLLDSWLQTEGEQATMNWARDLPEGKLKNGIVAQTAERVVRNQPAQAADWASSLTDEGARKEALKKVVYRWAGQDPGAAADWSLNLNDPSERSDYVASVTHHWARRDPEGASGWLSDLKPAPEFDEAFGGLARRLSREDPQSALTWAANVTDTATRQKLMEDIANGWYERDAEAARAFLER